MRYITVVPFIWEPYYKAFKNTCRLENVLYIDNTVVNRGVARSWNIGIKAMYNNGVDWLIIVSSAVRFGSSGGLDFVEHIKRLEDKYIKIRAQNLAGWHLVAFNRRIFDEVGYFDENFYPAYYEDIDFSLRFTRVFGEIGGRYKTSVDVDAKDESVAHGVNIAGVKVDDKKLINYFIKKWGRHPSSTTWLEYRYPFNDSMKSFKFIPAWLNDKKEIQDIKLQ